MKKVLLIILLLLVVLGIAAGVGVWKVRHLADSKLLIKEETIFTLKPGTGRLALGEQLYADKIINRPRVAVKARIRSVVIGRVRPHRP